MGAPSLWGVSAQAQDAGVGDAGVASDAGPLSPPDGETSDGGAPTPTARLVYPAPGSTGVVRGSSLLVVVERASLQRTPPRRQPPEPPALGEALLLRDDAGGIIAVGPLVAFETPRPVWAERAPENARVEIASGSLELEPLTHYQVLSRTAVCPAEDGARVVCEREAFGVLGDFTTGNRFDTEPPLITSVEVGPSPGECLVALSVTAADDHAPPEALRYESSGLILLGPNPVLPAPEPDRSGLRGELALTAIDPSNNRGLTVVVEVDRCTKPDVQVEDSFADLGDDYGGPPTTPPDLNVHSNDRGCAFAIGAPSAGTNASALALATLFMLRRRRARSLGR
ncbi:MAG TPA: hypothetical protein VMG12_22790 [Polyangiaceae bacterium]|nr:hypothetical protein [Polyangiaceae bacterium]